MSANVSVLAISGRVISYLNGYTTNAGQVAPSAPTTNCMSIEGNIGRIVIVLPLDLHNRLKQRDDLIGGIGPVWSVII